MSYHIDYDRDWLKKADTWGFLNLHYSTEIIFKMFNQCIVYWSLKGD